MRIIALLLFLISSLALPAQKVEKLWSGTTTVSIAGPQEAAQGIQRVLYQSPKTEQGKMLGVAEAGIGPLMFRAILDGRITGYADRQLRQKLTANAIKEMFVYRDTVQVIDPATYEMRISIVVTDPDPEDYKNLMLHLRLSYYADGSMQQDPLWVSLSADPEGPAVFFPVEKLTKAISFKGGAWNAVDRMTFSVPLDALEEERENQLYTDKIFDHLFNQLNNKPAGGFRNAKDWEVLSAAQLDGLLHPKDTVTIIDPNTYESKDKIVDGIPFYEGIGKISLVQFWAWDDAAARFAFSSIGYAPLEEFGDGKGGSVTRPTFYWVEKGYRK